MGNTYGVVDIDREESRCASYGEAGYDDDRPTPAECQRDEADRPRDTRPTCIAVRWTDEGVGTRCLLRQHDASVQHVPFQDPWAPLLAPRHPDYRAPEPAPW